MALCVPLLDLAEDPLGAGRLSDGDGRFSSAFRMEKSNKNLKTFAAGAGAGAGAGARLELEAVGDGVGAGAAGGAGP